MLHLDHDLRVFHPNGWLQRGEWRQQWQQLRQHLRCGNLPKLRHCVHAVLQSGEHVQLRVRRVLRMTTAERRW
jgi:hypothetical protein